MFYTYAMQSYDLHHYYIGFTSSLSKRLVKHNQGSVTSTKKYCPWQIIYTESFATKVEALKREKYLKSHAGRNWLKKLNSGS